MKRFIILMLVALLAVTGSVKAQIKLDEAGVVKKIAKLEADSKDPKKASKATTWIDLGKAYYDAAAAPSIGLYSGLDDKSMSLLFGKSENATKQIGDSEYKLFSYPHFDVYTLNGRVAFWIDNKTIIENALEKAAAAYAKAYSLDNAAKVNDGLKKVVDAYKQAADNNYLAQKYLESAVAFSAAYELQASAPQNIIDTISCFNAGFTYTLSNEFEKGEKYLLKASELGFENDGDVYYYLYFTYVGRDQFAKAKEILLNGIGKYPQNNRIVEGLLGLYSTTGEEPNSIIPYVMTAIEKDPKNSGLYDGLGRIYDKLGDLDKAIDAFTKAEALMPNDYGANFNLGLLIIKKGDKLAADLRTKPFTSQSQYNADLVLVNEQYAKSIVALEKAYAADPKEISTVELLKNVYFRLRDESPEMMTNYEKYNTLFKSMQ